MLFGMYSQRQKLYIVSNASTNVLNSVFAAVFTAVLLELPSNGLEVSTPKGQYFAVRPLC
jgi:hypothetical protein